jgi:CHAD domain-containing protein
MESFVEHEIKLEPGEAFVMPALGGETLPTRVFVSTYHDTADLRLARNGVTFRHRIENGTGIWQLKLPHGEARIELALPGPPARPPEEMLALLPAFLRGAPLVPVARLRTRREGRRTGGAEIVQDSVAVMDAQHIVRRFKEIEVELLEGDERTLRRLEKALRRAGADSPGPFRPKLYRALDLAWPDEEEPGVPETPAAELAVALRTEYRRLLAHDPGTRLGQDPEDLHQLRVATRRLRAFLRAARPLLDQSASEALRVELGWLGGALGPARDLDVLTEELRRQIAELGEDGEPLADLVADLEAQRAAARGALVAIMAESRYLALLDRLDSVGQLVSGDDDTTLARIWWRAHKRLRTAVERLETDPEDDALHAVRIDVKRARYAAELAEVELGKRGASYVRGAKTLQDILGDHQDAVVAETQIRTWVSTRPGAALGAGRLIERQRARRLKARGSWPDAWKLLEQAGKRAKP